MYCQVIVDIAHANVDRLFTYLIPEDMRIEPGHHVFVPFGQGNAKKEGFVIALTPDPPVHGQVKPVYKLIESYPVLTPDQLSLAEWMKKSYHCLLVDALRLMIPAQLRGQRVKEKIERTVSLSPGADPKALMASLRTKDGHIRAQKQYDILKLFDTARLELARSDVLSMVPGGQGALTAMVQKGWLTDGGHVTFRRPDVGLVVGAPTVMLNAAQQAAVSAVTAAMTAGGGTLLLHGVTGSGKTEVYMHCIDACLSLSRQAVMLVPEISLTPQTVGLFQARFGDRIAVLHSRLSIGERYDEWRRIRLGQAKVVIGARSAVFAPLQQIGILIVDEEHESSYQSETSPRYNAVDVALHRGKLSGAPVLLGSATPSLTTYYRAQSGRYALLELPERVQGRPMPKVEIVDMREEFLSGNNGIFSGRLVSLLSDCIGQGKQAMLFLNRRGYSTFVSCRACGYVMECPNCDLSMTYHKGENRLRCHFCGASAPLPRVCPMCGKPFIKYFGVGTEQVEEQLRARFPEVQTLRMDTDTTRTKDAMQNMLSAFSKGDVQVLIGTQMIAKGHDFPNVTLVGVIAADATLCIPDYRSTERTFQLLMQVSGRAGRDESPGRVVIQTYTPDHPAIRFARVQDYKSFYAYELAQRRKALFPPYSLFLRILFSGIDEDALAAAGQAYAKHLETDLRQALGEEGKKDLLLFSASPAPIKRKQGNFRYQILIKLLRTLRTGEAIGCVYAFADAHRGELFGMVEVNPQDML